MNHKGQSLVLFVCLLPLFIALLAFVFDSALIIRENNKLSNIASLALSYLVVEHRNDKEIENYILENDKNIEIVNLSGNRVHLKYKVKPIFGKIVGYTDYSLEVNLSGSINSRGKFVILKED